MIKVDRITNTCIACPSQWEAMTDKNENIYIRYRWGHLSICFRPSGEEIFDLDYGDYLDGCMDYDTLKELTKDVIEFPEEVYEKAY